MASQTIESYREGAEIVHGDAVCKKKSIELLEELSLPKGLFPLEDIGEFGYNRAVGFIWLVQKKKREHTFKKIKQASVAKAAEFGDSKLVHSSGCLTSAAEGLNKYSQNPKVQPNTPKENIRLLGFT
uniref:Uncharacterized protein n=1 Tax=Ananas comosus var. bracteatus TaxID=296719 RepID=A0A6V7PFP4_ANACO|nr:unnamed protein product [Ananas comosus var. bracteatus]